MCKMPKNANDFFAAQRPMVFDFYLTETPMGFLFGAQPPMVFFWRGNAHGFFPRSSERRVLLIVVSVICVCHTSSHLHIFTSSHSHTHIFTSSHITTSSSLHLHILKSSHTYLYIFTYSHLLLLSLTLTSSHLHIFTSSLTSSHSHTHIFTHIFTSSHTHIFSFSLSHSHLHILTSSLSLSPLSSLLSLSPFSLPFLSLAFFIFLSLGRGGAGEESRNVNPFARNEGRSSKTEEKLRCYLCRSNPFARNEGRCAKLR